MQTRLLEHLINNNILSTEQYGFRTKLTTENATYKLTNEVINAMNNTLIVGGMFCDLKKAFDCVNHDILLSKLEIYGITGKDKELYQSYLKGRHQRVSIYNKTHHYSILSNWALIKTWCPTRFHPRPSIVSSIYE
jgi:hypothetical protein